jgi:hypothetical protein
MMYFFHEGGRVQKAHTVLKHTYELVPSYLPSTLKNTQVINYLELGEKCVSQGAKDMWKLHPCTD